MPQSRQGGFVIGAGSSAGLFRLLEVSPEEHRRRRISFVVGSAAEVAVLGLLVVACAYYAKTTVSRVRRYVVLTFSNSVKQQAVVKPPELHKALPKIVAPYVLPRPRIELPRISEPRLRAEARVPSLTEPPMPKPAAKIEAPQLPPPPPTVHTGLFGQTPEKPVTEDTPTIQVQTGSFGAPHGIAGQAQGESPGNLPKLGSFDLPVRPGAGNGTRAGEGKPQVVADAGFSTRRELDEVDESDTSHRVAASGFGNGGVDAGAKGAAGGGAPSAVKTGFFAAPQAAAKTAARQMSGTPEIRPVEILSKPAPQYTEEARRLGVQGEVVLSVVFQADGTLKVVSVIKSLGHGLDQMAEQAALQIRFKPAEQAGKPTSFPAVLHIEFRLA